MPNTFRPLMIAACALLCAGHASAATISIDHGWFASWKLDRLHSRLVGPVIAIARSSHGYRFDFGATSFEVGDDGRDYPTVPTRTTSLMPREANRWLRTHKVNGVAVDQSLITVSPDQRTMAIETVAKSISGEERRSRETFQRIGTGEGLSGRWRSDTLGANVTKSIVIAETGNGRVAVRYPDDGQTYQLPLDGPAVPGSGSRAVPNVTMKLAARSPRELHWTVFISGKPYSEGSDRLARDGSAMVETSWQTSDPSEKQEARYVRE